MARRTRKFIGSLDGYRKLARRLRKRETMVRDWTVACLFRAFCELADETGVARPEPDLFRFLSLPPALEERTSA